MKIRISDLSVEEKLVLRDEVINEQGEDFWNYVESTDKPIPSCISTTNADYWLKVMTNGDLSKMPELLDYLLTNSKALIGIDLSDKVVKSKGNQMVVGRWYGATDGTSNNVITIFKYNGKTSGRIGWDRNGRWSDNLDDTYDKYSELVPEEMLVLAFAGEAMNRGYDFGVNTVHGVIEEDYAHEHIAEIDHFYFSNIKVYKDGDWNNAPIVDANDQHLNDVLTPHLRELLRQVGISLN